MKIILFLISFSIMASEKDDFLAKYTKEDGTLDKNAMAARPLGKDHKFSNIECEIDPSLGCVNEPDKEGPLPKEYWVMNAKVEIPLQKRRMAQAMATGDLANYLDAVKKMGEWEKKAELKDSIDDRKAKLMFKRMWLMD